MASGGEKPHPFAIPAWSLGYTISVLAGGLVATALPLIAHDFAVTPAQAIWILNAFAIASTVIILPGAAVAEMLGYKRVFQAGVVLFAVGAVLAAVAPSFAVLVAARVVQGLGCGASTACLGHFIRSAYAADRMGRGLALNAMMVSTAFGGGPAIAAAVLSVGTWRWLFWLVAIVAAASAAMSQRSLRDSPPGRGVLDIPSTLLNALATTLLIVAVQGLAHGGRPLLLTAEAVGAAATGVWFVRRQLRLPHPMLGVDLMRNPLIAQSVVTMTICFCAQGMALATLPFFLNQHVPGSGAHIGLLLACWPVGGVIVAPLAGRLGDRHPVSLICAGGMALFGSGLLLLTLSSPQAASWDLAWRIVIVGMGFALFGPPNTRGIMMTAPEERTGAATGLNATFRSLSGAVGAAVAAVLFGQLAGGAATPYSTSVVLLTAAGLAGLGMVFSLLRLRSGR